MSGREIMREQTADDPASACIRGVRISMPIAISSGILGIAYGAMSNALGMPIDVALASSLLIFTGAAQFSVLMSLDGDAGISTLFVSILVSLRLFLMAGSLGGHFRGLPLSRQLAALPLVSDGSWATAIAEPDGARFRWHVFMAAGVSIVSLWTLGTAVGHLASGMLPGASVEALMASGTIFLALLLLVVTKGMAWSLSSAPWLLSLVTAGIASGHMMPLYATLLGFTVGGMTTLVAIGRRGAGA
jgi:predicted branched-subunit amino acid permease